MADLGPMRSIVGLLEEEGRVVSARLKCGHEVSFGKTTSQAIRRSRTRLHCRSCYGVPTLEEEGPRARLRSVPGLGPVRVGWSREALLAPAALDSECARDRRRLAAIPRVEREQADAAALDEAAALFRVPEQTADFRYRLERLQAALQRGGRIG